MARVLFVSKPLVPPWNDSSKNLARDVAAGLTRHAPVVLGDGSERWAPPRGTVEPLYRDRGRFTPGLGAQARVFARLLAGPRVPLWHFFFAPNPKSSAAARVAARLRRACTVQTVCSRPRRIEHAGQLLFADRTVVLSRATHDELRAAGVPAERLAHIPPAVPPLEVPTPDARRHARVALGLPLDAPLVVYPGDLELGDGAPRIVDAMAHARPDAVLVMACRAKTAGARAAEDALRDRAARLGLSERTYWIGETARIHDLLGASDAVALPSSDLYAKMDLPLVLLEAMWLARPVLVADDGPAAELADDGAAIAVAPDAEAIADAIDRALDDRAIGERARRAAATRFSPARMAADYESLYDLVLEERP